MVIGQVNDAADCSPDLAVILPSITKYKPWLILLYLSTLAGMSLGLTCPFKQTSLFSPDNLHASICRKSVWPATLPDLSFVQNQSSFFLHGTSSVTVVIGPLLSKFTRVTLCLQAMSKLPTSAPPIFSEAVYVEWVRHYPHTNVSYRTLNFGFQSNIFCKLHCLLSYKFQSPNTFILSSLELW